MKVPFKAKKIKYFLWAGILYTILGSINLFLNEDNFTYIWILIGILHVVVYIYQKNKGYISIKNGIIRKHDFLSGKMNESDIQTIKEFAGDYILKNNKKELTITKEYLHEEALLYFENLKQKLAS